METICNLSLGMEKGDLNRAVKVAKKMIQLDYSIEDIV